MITTEQIKEQPADAPIYNVLSPDGFAILYDQYFTSVEDAREGLKAWSKNYETQGYYSSASFGRIPLEDLEEYCTLEEIDRTIFDD